MNRQTLLLDKIKTDGGTQARAGLNEDVVAEYAETIKAGIDMPPVTVFQDGKKFWLADGFHRFHAHRAAGAIQIEAEVRDGTRRDAILHSVGANASHGLRRSNADKRCAVKTLLADKVWGSWTDRQIADACGVSHPFVAGLRNPGRAAQQQAARDASATRKVESDSTTAPVAGTEQPHTEPCALSESVPVANPADVDVESVAATATHLSGNVPPAAESLGGQDAPSVDHDQDDDHDLLAELQQENARLIEQLRIAEADDLVVEALKWRRVAENAERQQSQAMQSASASQKREQWTKTQLMRCGVAVGEEDPGKIARAVEKALRLRDAA